MQPVWSAASLKRRYQRLRRAGYTAAEAKAKMKGRHYTPAKILQMGRESQARYRAKYGGDPFQIGSLAWWKREEQRETATARAR